MRRGAALLLVLLATVGCHRTTAQDCVLEHVKPGMSDDAVELVRWACITTHKVAPNPNAPEPDAERPFQGLVAVATPTPRNLFDLPEADATPTPP